MASFFSSILRPPQSTPQPTPPQTSTSSSSTLNPLPELRIDDPMILWQSLYNDGYCVLPG